jgi:hypothetical protein
MTIGAPGGDTIAADTDTTGAAGDADRITERTCAGGDAGAAGARPSSGVTGSEPQPPARENHHYESLLLAAAKAGPAIYNRPGRRLSHGLYDHHGTQGAREPRP